MLTKIIVATNRMLKHLSEQLSLHGSNTAQMMSSKKVHQRWTKVLRLTIAGHCDDSLVESAHGEMNVSILLGPPDEEEN